MSDRSEVVVDATVLVDLLASTELADAVRQRLSGTVLLAPAHVDAEVLSALGRLHRSGALSSARAGKAVRQLAAAPIARHELPPLLTGAWRRRGRMRLMDALYVELADREAVPLLTSDLRLARAVRLAEPIG